MGRLGFEYGHVFRKAVDMLAIETGMVTLTYSPGFRKQRQEDHTFVVESHPIFFLFHFP